MIDSLHLFCSVYSNLGFGFAFGCIIIIAEIINAMMTKPRSLIKSGCGTIILLLTLSAILTTVTSWMIAEYYDPVAESDHQLEKIMMEQWNIQGVPKKTLFLGFLAICPLWKRLEIKVRGVLKNSGISLCDRCKNFPN